MKRYTNNTQKGFLIALALAFGLIGFAAASSFNSSPQKASSCIDSCVALLPGHAEPDAVTVAVGDYVQFNSRDGEKHNLSLGKGGEEHEHSGAYFSGDFGADEAWRVQFKEPGTYTFHDHYHPKISVTVVVYTPGAEYKLE